MRALLIFLWVNLTLAASICGQVLAGESIEYDPVGKRFLTSDDGTSIVQRAQDGTVSYFGTGLKASYGMEIFGGKLYALEGAKLLIFDLQTATQVGSVTFSGTTFLNGLASDGQQKLWATDFTAKKVFQIDFLDPAAPMVTTLVANFGGQPNGIVFDQPNNRLVVASWGSNAAIKAVSLPDGGLMTLKTTALGNIDGLDMDVFGNFYTASWTPARITQWKPDFSSSQTISVPGINKPADICFVNETDTIAIPNTGGNNTLFVGFSPISSVFEAKTADFGLKITPVPMSENGKIEFNLSQQSIVKCQLLDASGRVVFELAEGVFSAGHHEILTKFLPISPGLYFCELVVDGRMETKKLIIR